MSKRRVIRYRPQPEDSPMKRRALELAETTLEASGLRYQSAQIPGLALIFCAFAEREMKLANAAPPPQEPT